MTRKSLLVLACSLINFSPCQTVQANKVSQKTEQISSLKYSNKDLIIMAIKSQEGLRLKAYFDTNHWSIGWGTVSKQNAEISLQEADAKFNQVFEQKLKSVSAEFSHLDEWSKLVLTSLKYNISTVGPRLERAIKSGNKKAISEVMQAYVFDANGVKLKGLINRRKLEAKLLCSSIDERQKIAEDLEKIVKSHIIRIKKI